VRVQGRHYSQAWKQSSLSFDPFSRSGFLTELGPVIYFAWRRLSSCLNSEELAESMISRYTRHDWQLCIAIHHLMLLGNPLNSLSPFLAYTPFHRPSGQDDYLMYAVIFTPPLACNYESFALPPYPLQASSGPRGKRPDSASIPNSRSRVGRRSLPHTWMTELW